MSAACGSGDHVAAGPVVRDSAGVTIVENRGEGAWSERVGWRLSPEPLVDIGVVAGAPEYRLFRAYDAARLSDGRIVVANGGTNELRFYDPAGEFLLAAGRDGEGPGEFRDLQAVWRIGGDSLLAYDFGVQRLSVFTPDGTFARSFRVESPTGRQLFVRGPFGDRSLLVTKGPRLVAAGAAPGMVRDSVGYFRYGPEGALIDTLGRFPFTEFYRLVLGSDDYRLTSPPFARSPRATVTEDRFYFGTSDRWELAVYTRSGALERRIRLQRANRPVTPEDVSRFKAERLERAREEGSRAVTVMERMLAAVPFPETMPAYGARSGSTRKGTCGSSITARARRSGRAGPSSTGMAGAWNGRDAGSLRRLPDRLRLRARPVDGRARRRACAVVCHHQAVSVRGRWNPVWGACVAGGAELNGCGWRAARDPGADGQVHRVITWPLQLEHTEMEARPRRMRSLI